MSARNKLILVLIELGLWVSFILIMSWLWDRWLVPGPHGTIRWVGMDFVLFWVGVRTMLAGLSPYSPGTTQLIQAVLLGGPPAAGGDPMLFVYPAWIFLLLLPLVLLPLKWAAALWTGSMLLGILNFIGYLSIRWGDRHPVRTGLWAVVLAIGCLPYVSIAVTKGQLILVGMGALFLAIHLVQGLPSRRSGGVQFFVPGKLITDQDTLRELLAGLFLSISILKPTLVVIPVAGMLIWALVERRFYFLAGFAFSIGILFLASWFAVGNWIPDYLQMLKTTGGAPVLWSLALLDRPWNVLFALLFTGMGVYAFIRFLRLRKSNEWFSAVIVIGLALFPMRWIYDLMLGILVPAAAGRMGRLAAVSVVLALLAPWGLALFPGSSRQMAQVIVLPLVWLCVWLACFVLPARSGGNK
jgi:hypothetical protein